VRTEGNSVSLNALDDIKRKAKFSIVDDGSIDWLSDRIKPYMLVEVPPWVQAPGGYAEFALGVFLLSTPEQSESDDGTLIREVEAYDQTVILKNYKVSGKYLIAGGTLFTDALKTILNAAGITRINIAPSTLVTPADREWDGGTTALEIANDLLKAMNYWSIWFDEEGWATSSPYVLPDQAASEYTYSDDNQSVIARPVKRKLDLFDIPNQWVFYTSEAGSAVPLRSVYTNSSASSQLSTVNRGMTIVDYRQVEAADQATLDGLVQRAAVDAMQVFETVSWQSWLQPMHAHMDSYTLVYSGMGINGKYRETSWSMDLRANGVMTHDCRKAVSV
jgi:hypothetical protein